MAQKGTKRKYTTITIPQPLFDRISKMIKGTGFSSVSDYVTYVLRETVADMKGSKGNSAERSAVVEKLKALGYTW